MLTQTGKGYCVEVFSQGKWQRQTPPEFDFASDYEALRYAQRQILMPLRLTGKITHSYNQFRVSKSA